jgi:hypothetical protein
MNNDSNKVVNKIIGCIKFLNDYMYFLPVMVEMHAFVAVWNGCKYYTTMFYIKKSIIINML